LKHNAFNDSRIVSNLTIKSWIGWINASQDWSSTINISHESPHADDKLKEIWGRAIGINFPAGATIKFEN
jgi:hypothetical protein